MRTNLMNKLGIRVLLLVAAALLVFAGVGGTAHAATVTVNLCATTGTMALPGTPSAINVAVWGYSASGCGSVTQPGGPVIYANAGDTISINLTNNVGEPTALLFQGQAMPPDLTGVANGASKVYSFTAAKPGTYLYEAGLLDNAQHQVAMGLYGALVIRPAAAGQAYDDASTAFTDEAVVVLSEIDPALNSNPAAFDMRNYAPKYRLINGAVHPQTAAINIATPLAAPASKLLLRTVNAGLEHHSMALLGLNQTVIANDGSPLGFSHTVVADTIAPGETQDSIAMIPNTTPAGTKFALYDANLMLRNSNVAGAGGMLAFISVGVPAPPPAAGPAVSAVSVTPNPTNGASVTLNATITAGTGLSVSAAEYFIDATGANGTGVAMNGVPGASPRPVNSTVNVGSLTSGNHTFYVHGRDSSNNWGPFAFAVLRLDKTGPAVSNLTLAPNPSNGTANVVLNGTADDSANGGSNIAGAEYFIGAVGAAGTGSALTPNTTANPIASLSATIPAATVNALAEGVYTLSVRSRDALGNWGGLATIILKVDKTGPAATGVSASPSATNGQLGYNSSTSAVRVFATFTDPIIPGGTSSNVAAGEGFVDCVPPGTVAKPCAVGSGIIFIASDGAWNSASETAYADIPLSQVQQLTAGLHSISVHGKDVAGNWGTTYGSATLNVDRTSPTLTAFTLNPTTIAAGTASVSLSVTASDPNPTPSGVTGGQYWFDGSATPPANPGTFTGTSSTINTSTLTGGNHTVYVRVRDAASNWSAVLSRPLTVIQAVNDAKTITASGSATAQVVNYAAAAGLLANDLPAGVGATRIASAPVRTGGTGAGTITVTCQGGTGNTAATPAISGNTVCTNGAFRITLNAVGSNNNQRAASRRGTYQFTYTQVSGAVTSTATVTITVN
jgi:hypothetical protein